VTLASASVAVQVTVAVVVVVVVLVAIAFMIAFLIYRHKSTDRRPPSESVFLLQMAITAVSVQIALILINSKWT